MATRTMKIWECLKRISIFASALCGLNAPASAHIELGSGGFQRAGADVGGDWLELDEASTNRGAVRLFWLSNFKPRVSGTYQIEAIVKRGSLANAAGIGICEVTFEFVPPKADGKIITAEDRLTESHQYTFVSPALELIRESTRPLSLSASCSSRQTSPSGFVNIPYQIHFLIKGPADREFREFRLDELEQRGH